MNTIDVAKLSKKEQIDLVYEILKINNELRQELEVIVPNKEKEISLDYIDKLITEDFIRYDEVFRKLA